MKTQQTKSFRPCLVMGYVDSAHASQCARLLRRQGWEVHCTPDADEMTELMQRHGPAVAVVDGEMSSEFAAQLAREHPATRVVVLGESPETWRDDGITYIPRQEGLAFLASEILLPQWA